MTDVMNLTGPTFPIAVVVPHVRSRADFFGRFGLPSIEANRPEQIIVDENSGGDPRLAAVSRNRGAKVSRSRYLFFCDDDVVLGRDCLSALMDQLERAKSEIGYAYSDHYRVSLPSVPTPYQPVCIHRSGPFVEEALRSKNFISTEALIRKEAFPGFDENLRRFQDWDLWLTMLDNGWSGLYVHQTLFFKFEIERGISADANPDAFQQVRDKHRRPEVSG